MDVTDDVYGGRVLKRATTEEERCRLAREVVALRALAHPGVVRLMAVEGGDPPHAVVLERVAGGPAGRDFPGPPEAILTVGASLAIILADVHDLGWAHLAVRPDHVLFDGDGRPVLGGFGSAVQCGLQSDRQRRDVDDLLGMLGEWLPPSGCQEARRLLNRARGRDARGVARLLSGGRPAVRLRSRWMAGGAAAVAAVAVTFGFGLARAPARRHAVASCPPVDQGCRPVSWPAGRYRLEFADPAVVVMGRWTCTAAAYPAVLDLRTGSVWMFGGWPSPAHPSTARLYERVAGATSLTVQPGPSGCDGVQVSKRRAG